VIEAELDATDIITTELFKSTKDACHDVKIDGQLPSAPELLLLGNGTTANDLIPTFDWRDMSAYH
jgi:hypothetical protein